MTMQTKRRVRTEERNPPGHKRRYWDPKDGLWTHPLGGNASMERFYIRVKGFMLVPPGELAIYAVTRKLESRNPDPRARAEEQANAFAGPFPIGEKTTTCNCLIWHGKNCTTWEQHYLKKDLVVHHMVKDEQEPSAIDLSQINVLELVELFKEKGYTLVKDDEGTPDGTDADLQKEPVGEHA